MFRAAPIDIAVPTVKPSASFHFASFRPQRPVFTAQWGFASSPVIHEEKVIVRAWTDFYIIAKNSLGEVNMASPALSGDILFFRTREHVVAIGKQLTFRDLQSD